MCVLFLFPFGNKDELTDLNFLQLMSSGGVKVDSMLLLKDYTAASAKEPQTSS